MPADDEDVRKTRSSSAVKRKRASSPPPALNNGSHGPEWHSLFEPTPLEELVLEGMGPSELWEQLELRGAKIARLIDTVVISDALNPDEDPEGSPSEEEEDEDEDEDEDDDEEDVRLDQLTDAELRAIGIDPERLDELEMDSEDEESSMGEGYAGASDLSDEDADQIVYEQLRTEKEQQARKAALEAAELSRLRGMGGEDEDEDEDEAEVDDDALLDEGEEEGGEEQQETQPSRLSRSILDSLDEPGSSTAAGVRRGPRHATLDDDFFSIDEFNRITEHQEREAARKARSSNADEDEDEDEDINDIDLFKSKRRISSLLPTLPALDAPTYSWRS